MSNRKSGDQIVSAAKIFIRDAEPKDPEVLYNFFLALFEIDAETQIGLCNVLRTKMGLEIDDNKYTVMVFKHLPGGGRTSVTVDLTIGRKMAERKLYDRFNALHDEAEADCLPPDQFYDALRRESGVTAKIDVETDDEDQKLLNGQYDFVLYNVTSAVTTIPRFEQEATKKKKKWKKAPEDLEEDEIEDDDEEEGSVDDWPEDDDSDLDNG